jgi:ABC-2 type transport system permease protein
MQAYAVARGSSAKYAAVCRITLLSSLVYGRDVALRASWMVLALFVFVQLWTFTFENQPGGVIEGFTLGDMIWYLVMTETVALSAPRVSMKIDEEVKSGELAYVLAKPYNYVLYHLAGYWGEGALRLPVNFAVGSVIALATIGPPETSLVAVLAAAVAVVFAVTINFLVEASIGLTAFWFEDSQPFFWIYQKLVFTVGGLFLPLEFLPGLLRDIASVLPFATVTYTPARLLVAFEWQEAALRFGLQIVWLLVIAAGCWAIYSRAVRRVSVHGG